MRTPHTPYKRKASSKHAPRFSVQPLTAKLVDYFSDRADGRPRWYWATGTTELPPLKSRVVILRHKLPAALVSVNEFVKQHRVRYALQRALARGGMASNPSLSTVQAVALPVFAGFDSVRNEFVVVMPYQNGGTPLPKRIGHIEYAALERSLCKVWSSGYQFASLDVARMSVSAFEVMMYDCSQLVGKLQWLATQFLSVAPGQTPVRFETLYAPGGDATFMTTLYERLPPRLKPSDRDALVDAARRKLWRVSNTKNGTFFSA